MRSSVHNHWIKRFTLSILFSVIFIFSNGQEVLVDFEFNGRQLAELNEPGYSSWVISPSSLSEYTEKDVTFKVVGTHTSSWYKAGVQAPNYARLANDGIEATDIEFQITGLAAGQHSLLTFHNSFHNPLTETFPPIDIFVNGTLVHDDLIQSNRVNDDADAATAFVTFTVTEGQTAIIRFRAEPTSNASYKKVFLNGFELNTGNAALQANAPYPDNLDTHANADAGQIELSWRAADGAISHDVYVGGSYTAVFGADKSSAAFVGNVTSTSKVVPITGWEPVFWRVDEVYADGTTKGDVWQFEPRHLAFEGAEGHGASAKGGRGGKVVYVTNLNDDGPGSFRAAVTGETGPRTVLFNVSGVIYLNSRLVLDDNITVAGQTSPGKGICFRAAPIGLGNDNIVRFVRMRLGAGTTYDGIGMAGAKYTILDHASISWTIDEAFSSRGAHNMTLQRTLISEALNVAGHKNYPVGTKHGYAATIGGDIGSFHHNLLAHNEGRNWSLGGGLDGNGYYAGRLDIFNNVVYNWGGRATDGGAHEVNFVGNYYKKGPATSQSTILNAQLEGVGLGSQSYYYHNNIVESTSGSLDCNGSNDSCSRKYTTSNGQIVDWTVFVDQAFFGSEATIQSASDAYKSVLSDVGCYMPLFDDHDVRIIQETLNGTYTYSGSYTGKKGLIDHQDDAGGYEDYPFSERPADFDSDKDGLPNWWESLYGSNVNSDLGDFSDANADSDSDGYTDLEEYLMWMATPYFEADQNQQITINLAPFTKGFESAPTYQIVDTKNGTASLVNSNQLSFQSEVIGLSEVTLRVTDSQSSSMEFKVGVRVGIDVNDPVTVEKELIISKLEAEVTEGGTTDTFTVKLATIPSGNVVLDVVTNDAAQLTVNPSSLTFTIQNAFTPQTVTLSSTDDDLFEGELSKLVTISVNTAQSSDYIAVSDKTVSVVVNDNDVILEVEDGQIRIYPNPVRNLLTVSSEDYILNVRVTSLLGHEILSVKGSGSNQQIDMSEVSEGIYLLEITTQSSTTITRILKR